MIDLTRLNHKGIAINCDLIEWIEAVPDTTVRMVSGEHIVVLESIDEVIQKITDYRRKLLAAAGIAAILTSGSQAVAANVRASASEPDDPPRHGSGSGR